MTDDQTTEVNAEKAVATVEERLASVEERVNRPRKRRPPALPAPPAPAPARRGCWGTLALFGGMSCLALTLVVAVMMLLATVEIAGFLRDPVDNFLAVFGFERDSQPTEVDSRTIVLGIREMSLLQTASGDVQIRKTVVDVGPAPDAELTVTYIGTAMAGIDLERVTEEDIVRSDDGTLLITLPPAQLTACFLNRPEIIHRRCVDIPLAQDCGAILQRLQEEAYDRALDELIETAHEIDLLGLANREAGTRVYELLTGLGHDKVAFRTGDAVLPPAPSCTPE